MTRDHDIAIIAMNPSQGERFLDYNQGLRSATPGRVFTYAESAGASPRDGDAWASSWALPGEPRFARVVSCLPLFASGWSMSYLAWLSRLLLPGGSVLMPFKGNEAETGLMTPTLAAELFGTEAVPVPGTRLVVFTPSGPVSGPPSVHAWFMENMHKLALGELRYRFGGTFDALLAGPDLADMLDGTEGLDGSSFHGGDGRRETEGTTGLDVETELEDIQRKHVYLVGGIRYKAALVEHVIQTLHPSPVGLDFLDMGGNLGLLAVELLLSSKGMIRRAVNREPSGLSLLQGALLYGSFHQRLRGRFRFSLGGAQDYGFGEPLDVITILGTLLYVSREHHAAILGRAWEVLRPGGLLILHENIKNSAKRGRDYDLMFEPEELEALLGRFGPARRYPNWACTEIPAPVAGRQALFRVIQKA